jgi:uncharacterized membrane protein YbhN (UPF0104 family)
MKNKYLKYSFLVIFSFALLIYIKENSSDFQILKEIKIKHIISFYVLYLIFLTISCFQSFEVIGDNSIKRTSYIKIFILSRFFSKLIPQSGNAYMAQALKSEFSLKYARYIERLTSLYLIDVFFLFIFSLATVFFINDSKFINHIFQYSNQLIYLFLITFSIFVFVYFMSRKGFSSRLMQEFRNILLNIFNILRNLKLISKVFCYSVLSFVTMAIIFYQILNGLSLDANLFNAVIFLLVFRISNLVQLTPGNLGISEFVLGFLSSIIEMGFTNGLLISLIYRVIAYSSLFVLGITITLLTFVKNKDV